MKRKIKRRLKEDELVTTVGKVLGFTKKRSRELIAGAVVVVLAVLIFVGVRFVKAQNIRRESKMLGEILSLYSDLETKPENMERLEEVAGKGKFSRLAYILLANHWVENEDFSKAEESLQKIVKGKKDLFYYQAQDLLAQIHLKRKEYDKAIAIYKQIEEEAPKDYTLDVVLFHQAEAHEQKGNIQEALALYKRVQEEFPQTFYGYDATQKVQKLEKKK